MPTDDSGFDVLQKILAAHYKSLVEAKSDPSALRQYSRLLRFLKTANQDFLERLHVEGNRKGVSDETVDLPMVFDYSLERLNSLVTDESTPRRVLEAIAIHRFSIPKGSMRSFPNRKALVDKLRTSIGNEKAHETIGLVARSQDQPTDPNRE